LYVCSVDCGKYINLCDDIMFAVLIVSYFMLLVFNTINQVSHNVINRKIYSNAIVLSVYASIFFGVLILNAEFKPHDMSMEKILFFWLVNLLSYAFFLSCVGVLISMLTQFVYMHFRKINP